MVFGGLDPAVQILGHAEHLAPHGLDRLGRALLGGADMVGHLAQPAFHAVEAAVGRGMELLGHLDPGGLDPLGEPRSHLLEPTVDARRFARLHRLHPAVQMGEGFPKALQRLGGAGLGLAQPLRDAADDFLDQTRRLTAALSLHPIHPGLDGAQGLAGAGLAVIEMVGDLGDGALQGAQSLGRAGTGGLRLHPAQPFGHARLFAGDAFHGALEAGGHGDVLAFRGLDPRQGGAHRMLDAGHGQTRAALRNFQSLAQTVERQGDPPHLVGRMFGGLDAGGGVVGAAGAFEIQGGGSTCDISF